MKSIPLFEGFNEYQKPWLRLDLVAGLTTAAVVVPKAMAYATIAGLPVTVGLYTAFVPMVIYAILGTSRAVERQHYNNPRNSDRDPTCSGST